MRHPVADGTRSPPPSAAEPSALADLLVLVEAAAGHSKDLNAMLWPLDPSFRRTVPMSPEERSWRAYAAPDFTASLDAALALVERVLPGLSWDLHFTLGDAPYYTANLLPPAREFYATRPTPALALLAAMLRALIALRDDSAKAEGR